MPNKLQEEMIEPKEMIGSNKGMNLEHKKVGFKEFSKASPTFEMYPRKKITVPSLTKGSYTGRYSGLSLKKNFYS